MEPQNDPVQLFVSPQTVLGMAREIVGVPLEDKDLKGVIGVLQFLHGDLAALKAMPVGASEPALVFDAAEVES